MTITVPTTADRFANRKRTGVPAADQGNTPPHRTTYTTVDTAAALAAMETVRRDQAARLAALVARRAPAAPAVGIAARQAAALAHRQAVTAGRVKLARLELAAAARQGDLELAIESGTRQDRDGGEGDETMTRPELAAAYQAARQAAVTARLALAAIDTRTAPHRPRTTTDELADRLAHQAAVTAARLARQTVTASAPGTRAAAAHQAAAAAIYGGTTAGRDTRRAVIHQARQGQGISDRVALAAQLADGCTRQRWAGNGEAAAHIRQAVTRELVTSHRFAWELTVGQDCRTGRRAVGGGTDTVSAVRWPAGTVSILLARPTTPAGASEADQAAAAAAAAHQAADQAAAARLALRTGIMVHRQYQGGVLVTVETETDRDDSRDKFHAAVLAAGRAALARGETPASRFVSLAAAVPTLAPFITAPAAPAWDGAAALAAHQAAPNREGTAALARQGMTGLGAHIAGQAIIDTADQAARETAAAARQAAAAAARQGGGTASHAAAVPTCGSCGVMHAAVLSCGEA